MVSAAHHERRPELRLGVALPQSEAEFHAPVAGEPRDFLRGEDPGHLKFWARLTKELAELAGSAGVAVETLRMARDLAGLFVPEAKVVAILGHTTGQGELELLHERLDAERLLDCIPPDFEGLLDLRTCSGGHVFADLVRVRRPRCIVRGALDCVGLRRSMYAFSNTLTRVIRDGVPYDQAARLAWANLIDLHSKAKGRPG